MLKKILAMPLAMAAIALLCSATTAHALGLGDPAPKLTVKRFVKGEPVTKFEKGKVYVVEFWATWCGPCKESIPHLTQLAKKNKSVTFIGVSVWENSQKDVAPFVAKMGSKMVYHVALDSVPAGKEGDAGAMATHWMTAAKQEGIPTAFIIDKQSRVAWIGHPMEMEEPLAKIVAGKWDLKAEAEKARTEAAKNGKLHELQVAYENAMEKKDYDTALKSINDALQQEPSLEEQLAPLKISVLQLQSKDDDIAAYLTKLTEGAFKDDAEALDGIVWPVSNPEAEHKPTPAVAAAALKAAQRADEIEKSKDTTAAMVLAAAYFANGSADKAVEAQTRAIQLAKGTPLAKEPSLEANLAKYKAAVKQ